MRWFKAGLLAGPFALLSLTLLTTGCGPSGGADDDDYKPVKRRSTGVAQGPKEELLKPVTAQNNEYSTITGKVSYDGPLPDLVAETAKFIAGMGTDVYCTGGIKPDKSVFPLAEIEKLQQDYRVGKNNLLGNVFVWIEPAAPGHFFKVPEEQLKKFANTKVMLSQPHCVFLPHCSVVFPKYYQDGSYLPTGQVLQVENDAYVGHNAKITGGANSLNETISARSPGKEFVLQPHSEPITISCNVHGWMRGYILARDHPYAAVSSVGADLPKKVWVNDAAADFGTYKIEGVPVGAKVRLRAWHEKLGFLEPKAGQEITLTKEPMTKDLVAKFR